MNLKKYLFSINRNLKEIIVQPIDKDGSCIGYNAVLFDNSNYPYSGGTHEEKEMAIRIAISEGIERSLFEILKKNDKYSQFLAIDEFPSTAGFAAGFDQKQTKSRSIYEAIERWAWSKWIDSGFHINEFDKSNLKLNKLAENYASKFDDFLIFQRKIILDTSEHHGNMILNFNVFLGLKGNGIFPGSRVCNINEDGFGHSVIEAFRNLNNFEGNNLNTNGDIIEKRILFFANNKEKAIMDINKAQKINFPRPEIKFCYPIATGNNEVFLYRSLCKDFIGWNEGDEDRFVY